MSMVLSGKWPAWPRGQRPARVSRKRWAATAELRRRLQARTVWPHGFFSFHYLSIYYHEAQVLTKFIKVGSNDFQILNKPTWNCQRHFVYAIVVIFRHIWSHWARRTYLPQKIPSKGSFRLDAVVCRFCSWPASDLNLCRKATVTTVRSREHS